MTKKIYNIRTHGTPVLLKQLNSFLSIKHVKAAYWFNVYSASLEKTEAVWSGPTLLSTEAYKIQQHSSEQTKSYVH